MADDYLTKPFSMRELKGLQADWRMYAARLLASAESGFEAPVPWWAFFFYIALVYQAAGHCCR